MKLNHKLALLLLAGTAGYVALQNLDLLQQAGRLARLGAWEDVRGQGLVYWSDTCYDIHGLVPGAPLPRDYLNEFVAPSWRHALRNLVRQSIDQQTECRTGVVGVLR